MIHYSPAAAVAVQQMHAAQQSAQLLLSVLAAGTHVQHRCALLLPPALLLL
jgi:hypothetical protein